MTCPPCTHNCRQGRDCPSRPCRTWRGLWVAFAAVFGLSGCVGHNPTIRAEDVPPIYHVTECDPGGIHSTRINDYMMPLEASGALVVVDSPCLSSAGTYYLALRRACITPRVVARFHGPVDVVASSLMPLPGMLIPASGDDGRIARQEMLAMFRELPRLQSWLAEGLHQTRFRSLDYSQLVSMGVRACTALEIELARSGRATVELED